MASNNTQLDDGFQEEALDDGFQEVPVDRQPQSLVDPNSFLSKYLINGKIGKALQGGASDLGEASAAGAMHGVESGTGRLAGKSLALALASKDVLGNGGVPDIVGASGLVQKYQKYKQAIKDKENQITNDSPVSSAVGDVAGTLAAAPLVPELGGEAAIAKAGDLATGLDAFLQGQSGGALSRIAGKTAGSAVDAAPLGIAQGATNDDANDTEGYLKGVASSGLMASLGGSVLGSGLKIAGEVADAVPDLAKKYDFTRKIGEAYNYGKSGQSFDTSEGKSLGGAMRRSIPNEITNTILAADRGNGEAVGNALNPDLNPNAANPINIDPDILQASSNLFNTFSSNPLLLDTVDPKSKALLMKLGNLGVGSTLGQDMSPLEAKALSDALYNLSNKMDGMTSDVSSIVRQNSKQVGQALDSALADQVPEYADAAKKFADYRSQIVEPLLEPNLPADKRTKFFGNLKDKQTKLYKAVDDVFGSSMLPGEGAQVKRTGLDEVLGNLDNIEQNNPSAMQTLGGSAQDVKDHWSQLADKLATLKQTQGVHQIEGATNTMKGSIVGTGEGFIYNMANRTGRAADMANQSFPVKLGAKLFGADNSALSDLAQKLKTSNFKGGQIYGDALEKAVGNKADWSKNAVLFKLMQDPDYRNWLRNNGYLDLSDDNTPQNQ